MSRVEEIFWLTECNDDEDDDDDDDDGEERPLMGLLPQPKMFKLRRTIFMCKDRSTSRQE